MRTSEEPRGERAEGARKLGLCVLCGLPAAGKSTLARALAQRLRLELGWAVGVVAYDDVMPEAVPEEARARPLPAQWKRLRQELLAYLESLLGAVTAGAPLAAPPQMTEAMWADFVACLKNQDLLPAPAPDAPSRCPLLQAAGSRPLLLILDDNFYYQSMRYEVYQLARKYSSGFCQLFLDCPLETCLARNAQRARPVPAETLRQMAGKLERPDPERNAWERLSLSVPSTEGTSRDSQKLTDLLRAALDDPVKAAEDNLEQKEADRAICAENALHQADQGLRRVVSQTMKEAKGRAPGREETEDRVRAGEKGHRASTQAPEKASREAEKPCPVERNPEARAQPGGHSPAWSPLNTTRKGRVPPCSLKLLAQDLNKLKAEFLEDLRQGHQEGLRGGRATHASEIISLFHCEKRNIVQRYLPKNH